MGPEPLPWNAGFLRAGPGAGLAHRWVPHAWHSEVLSESWFNEVKGMPLTQGKASIEAAISSRITGFIIGLLCSFQPKIYLQVEHFLGFPGGSDSKESACNAGDLGSIPGLGRSPGGGNGYPLQSGQKLFLHKASSWHLGSKAQVSYCDLCQMISHGRP